MTAGDLICPNCEKRITVILIDIGAKHRRVTHYCHRCGHRRQRITLRPLQITPSHGERSEP